jgi:chromosomal replication initiation ATPase DnaA
MLDIFKEAIEDFKNVDLPKALYGTTPIKVGVPEKTERLQMRDILLAVSNESGFSTSSLKSARRNRDLSRERFKCYYLMHKLTGCNISDISRFMHKNHTTILSGLNRAKDCYENDGKFARSIDRLHGCLT